MINIAILGYGAVGSGLAELIKAKGKTWQLQIAVKYVVDIRDVSSQLENTATYTTNFDTILADDDVTIVVEAIGGTESAYNLVKQALLKGKHVCTSNKELVTTYGAELLQIASNTQAKFMFEASVGGGTPVIQPMYRTLQIDQIIEVAGILNGTTNYILSTMSTTTKTYETILQDVQQRNYAEKNPWEDVGGFDAARKLAILLSLATGNQLNFRDIHTEGINNITRDDFSFAHEFGFTIKPLVWGYINQNGIYAISAPILVHRKHPLANVCNAFNAAMIKTASTGNLMFYGEGAGKTPTATAIMADIFRICSATTHGLTWSTNTAKIQPFDDFSCCKLVQVAGKNRAFITAHETEHATAETLKNVPVAKMFRIYDYD
ncbi:MAG: homoserine dehydrogenase [Firmicutes bacterium]|nr:homoserine dehydrogenase [Bacillota bacterium]